MKQVYLARHGNYGEDGRLSPYGVSQVQAIGDIIDKRLPKNVRVLLLASPEKRTVHTGEELLPFLRKKSSNDLSVQTDDRFYWTRAGMFYKDSIKKSEAVIELLETSFQSYDVVVVTTHKENIGTLGIGIPKHYDIPYSNALSPWIRPPDDEQLIAMTMENETLPRDEAIQWLIQKYPEYFTYPPSHGISEASTLFFDLEQKVVEMLSCGLRSVG
jgi:phosphohistidine phosphatase SixA